MHTCKIGLDPKRESDASCNAVHATHTYTKEDTRMGPEQKGHGATYEAGFFGCLSFFIAFSQPGSSNTRLINDTSFMLSCGATHAVSRAQPHVIS